MMFWIDFDLIFALFYMQVITMVFWTVLDLIITFFCLQAIHMLFWGGFGLDLQPLLLASDHRDILD